MPKILLWITNEQLVVCLILKRENTFLAPLFKNFFLLRSSTTTNFLLAEGLIPTWMGQYFEVNYWGSAKNE